MHISYSKKTLHITVNLQQNYRGHRWSQYILSKFSWNTPKFFGVNSTVQQFRDPSHHCGCLYFVARLQLFVGNVLLRLCERHFLQFGWWLSTPIDGSWAVSCSNQSLRGDNVPVIICSSATKHNTTREMDDNSWNGIPLSESPAHLPNVCTVDPASFGSNAKRLARIMRVQLLLH